MQARKPDQARISNHFFVHTERVVQAASKYFVPILILIISWTENAT
jgi:hypothetical protein